MKNIADKDMYKPILLVSISAVDDRKSDGAATAAADVATQGSSLGRSAEPALRQAGMEALKPSSEPTF